VAPKAKGKFSLTTKVGPGSFKQPVWIWAAVGVGAWYVYTRATQAAPTPEVAEATGTTYADTAGYADTYGTYDSGAGGGVGGTYDNVPPEVAPPPTEVIPPDGSASGHDHVDRRKQRRRQITRRIHRLQRGGVTATERPRIRKLRERRKALRG
jgi:hypothetical protein